MRNVKYGIIFVIAACLFSCTSTPEVLSEKSTFLKPKIGEETIAFIGDPIISEISGEVSDVIKLKKAYGRRVDYHPEGNYKFCGERVVNKGKEKVGTVKEYIFSSGRGNVYPRIRKYSTGEVCLVFATIEKKIDKSEYSEEIIFERDDEYFEQQLIYTGIEGNVLKFSYREFKGEIARPAFTVDATYDMSKNRLIRFKQSTLEIIRYDNQSITYKVLSGFN